MKKIFKDRGDYLKIVPLGSLLFFLILQFTFLESMARESQKRINLKVEDASIEEVLSILQQHEFRLVYPADDIISCSKQVTLTLRSVTVREILEQLLDKTNLTFKIEENLITIKKIKEDSFITVNGTVLDQEGEPLIGVAVVVKGTHAGVSTNIQGNFTIRVPLHSCLVFSFIGMEKKEIVISHEEFIKVTLFNISSEMEEIVVTGFQVLKKRESTSSIVTLKAEDIIEPVGTSIDQMLQGKVPGMAVMQQTSTVMATPKIRIRGSSSIIGSREPVWVVDGIILKDPVKLDATELNSMDKVNLIGNAISGLNPEDIERIDILKDASATALYGTKAANGVIVITTKRGKEGITAIRYSNSMSFVQQPTYDKMFLMNSKERIKVSEEMQNRGLQFSGFNPRNVGYEGALQALWDNQISQVEFDSQIKALKEMNTDWFSHLFRNAFSHSHTLSASGGSKQANYYFSAGYSDQQGASLNEKGTRYSFMSNLGFKVSTRFNVNASLSASVNKTNRPTVDLFQYTYQTSRAISPYNPDGSLLFYDQSSPSMALPENLVFNIFNELNHTGSSQQVRALGVNVTLDYKLASWLSVNSIVSYNSSAVHAEDYADEQSYKVSELRAYPYGYNLANLTPHQQQQLKETFCKLPYGGFLNTKTSSSDALSARFSFNLNKVFNNVHSVSLNSGMSLESVRYQGYQRLNYGYLPDRGKNFVTIDGLSEWPLANQTMLSLKPVMSDNTTHEVAYYASLSYSYMSKYILSANVRGDASNKLGSDDNARFLPVWSFSGRWNVNDELFMQPLASVLSNFALRGSFGLQGNVTEAHNPNMMISLGSFDSKGEQYYASLISLPNPGLVWEKTASWNLGLDWGFLNGRLSGCVEYYHKKGRDMLLALEVETTNGGKLVTINGGDMENKGWELSLSATAIQTKDFSWTLSFNTSKNYNKITNAGDREYSYNDWLNGTIIKNGYAVNSFYSYRFAGLDSKGLPTFHGLIDRDETGNEIINTKEQAFASAMSYSGNREPKLTGGLSSYFKWKRLSLNCIFSLALGAKVRLNELYAQDKFQLPYPHQNMSSDFQDRWQKPGDEYHTNIPGLTDQLLTIGTQTGSSGVITTVGVNYWQMYNNCDLRVISGNFLRCRSLSISYSLPDKVTRSLWIKSASLGLSVSNPFVIKSKELNGRDPEQVTMGSGTIPPQQTYSMTFNISF